MKAHEAVIRLLVAEDVDTIFALMSEDTMTLMSKVEENWNDSLRLIKTRHEQGAVAMADGYARVRDELGVCIVGRGPAVSQVGNGLVTARKNGSNLLVIVPETSLSDTYDIKEFNQEAYLRSTVGNVHSLRSSDTFVFDFKEALRQVMVGDEPVAVQIPWDILDGEIDAPGNLERETVGDSQPPQRASVEPDAELVKRAVDMYVDSDAFQPPVILAGRGAIEADAKAAIEELAERTSGLLATSLQARNYFADHPCYLGFTGSWGTNIANEFTNEAHLVFAIGASLNPYTVDDGHVFGAHTQLIHIDKNPVNINRYTDVNLGIQGDARATVEAINRELDRRDINRQGTLWTDDLRNRISESNPMNEREFPEIPGTVDPRDLVTELNDILPTDKKVVVDGGHFTRWALDGIHTPPEDFTFSLDFASIGLGLPMGIGTAMAADDESCVTLCGDAGFMMSIQELETAIRHDIPMTVIVMNDSSLGSEYHSLAVHGESPDVALVPAPDFADVAESFGGDGYTVRSIDDLNAIADKLSASHDSQLVVDCKVNHEVRHRSKT